MDNSELQKAIISHKNKVSIIADTLIDAEYYLMKIAEKDNDNFGFRSYYLKNLERAIKILDITENKEYIDSIGSFFSMRNNISVKYNKLLKTDELCQQQNQ